MAKNIRKQTNQKMTFAEAAKALQTTHTLSTKKICELLKTYRPWVSKYILPKLDKIYLNSGHKGSSRKSFDVNWVYMMSKALDDESIKESAWYKTSDFEKLLKASLISCTRQTIRVSSSIFVDADNREYYCSQYQELSDALDENKRKSYTDVSRELIEEAAEIRSKINELYDRFIGEKTMNELKKVVSIDKYGVSKRTLSPPEKYTMNWDYNNFQAVHDLKGYGGIDEQVYRDLFNRGAVKLIFNFTAENGDVGEKIFYTFDENDKQYRLEDGSPMWAVPYSFFLKNKKV